MSSPAPIVVGIDRSAESALALNCALGYAHALGRPLAVIHAVGLLEEAGVRPEPEVDELVAAAHRAVPEATDVEVTVVREDGPAADVILRVADRLGAGLIVVGRRGLGVAPRPLGSVSEAVLGRSTVPVLVVPAP